MTDPLFAQAGPVADGGSVMIIGALSDVGRALARVYGREGHPLILAARRVERLTADVQDLTMRFGVPVRSVELDVLDLAEHAAFLDGLGGLPDTVICVVGLLGRQQEAEKSWVQADLILRTNYLGPVCLLGEIANRMQTRGRGCIIGVSSVAGDRGRASNYLYGSAKAGFTAFLSGLRNRLSRYGVRVVTIKPGFIDTSMTRGMALPPALTAQPAEVAEAIWKAQVQGRDVVYLRPVWRLIMWIIRLMPESLFKKFKI
ncbi:SDR family oxidoreductase [Niveispirillum sp. SYP-B3756]|uniref:SDR family oxidoreductase n=1 Tax=Niveispirillum sp. SYP-B3756 TaxID=2662178 RepID=UPI0012929B20|nr:SDR family oxidoreductase [Niveispirillum sp. SYP-B3756]MQP65876.1 SDR family oxidoreductase [Niveispirillum sp. SYP-B3756]